MAFALSFNTPRSGIWGTCICLWILKQKSITSVPSFAALCLLCNKNETKILWLLLGWTEILWARAQSVSGFISKIFIFSLKLIFLPLIYIYSRRLPWWTSLWDFFFFIFFSLSHRSSLSLPTALSHCITFSSALVTLNKNRLRRPQEHEPNTYSMHCA